MDKIQMMSGSLPMPVFSDVAISLAGIADSEQLLGLVNSSYRGESSRRGWTTEADLIAGEVRIDADALQQVLITPGSIVLGYRQAETIVGCVNLQHKGDYLYLGMFSVSPEHQNAGIGKKLLQAAERVALQWDLKAIQMSVISVRDELIAWYMRNGYADTGERIPFQEDGMSGKHLRQLEFMVLRKPVNTN
jgi:ribosomal protein S18 acetylase RimI-like enzyme